MTLLQSHLKIFGSHTLAYTILQDKASYFQTDTGTLAYFKLPFSKRVAVLGDPLTLESDLVSFLTQFLISHPGALFYFISSKVNSALLSLGFKSHLIAYDNHLDLLQSQFSWAKTGTVKKQSNRAIRAGYFVEEDKFSSFSKESLSKIERSWILSRKNKSFEQCFLTRPTYFKDEEDVRVFFLFKNKSPKTFGYLVCLPMYKNHHISGYYLDAIRFMDSAPKATPYFLISEGIRLLKNEGIKHLSLGPYIPRKFETSSFYSLLSYFAGFIYSFRGIERFKKHFTATQSPLYISYCTVFLLPYIWQGIHLTLQPTLAKSVLLKYKSIFSPTTKD